MKKALIVIDVQKGFINKLTAKIVVNIRNYLLANSKKYDLVLFTKYYNHRQSTFVKNLKWRGFMKDNETDIAEQVQEFANSKNTFIKDTYSSFLNNKLFNVLKKNKIKQVELVGFDTENCVLTFARDAFDRGMAVVVYKNLTASHASLRLHRTALEIIELNIGHIK